ncbi:MAG: hypothetical protein PVH42_05570 [Desulfobacterales bacterium]
MKTIENIKAKVLPVIVICVWAGLYDCTRHHLAPKIERPSDSPTLESWLDNSLIPYLAQQLSKHPRFKRQPVLLVRMQGDVVQPHIDDLTDQIRQKIMDGLLNQPDLDLAWRPAIQPWKHHLKLEDVSCGDHRKIHYYIGIDCGLTRVEGALYVKVRALNLAEEKYVSGFGKTWQGTPTELQREALNREQPDNYLRGLRPLPFTDRQPDFLAAYLARNLSCLMRQGEEDEPVVYVKNSAGHNPRIFHITMTLLGKYLARFREVEVTDDPDQANITVVSQIHAIHKNLHQVWVAARFPKDGNYLPGVETEAYVLIDLPKPTMVTGNQPPNRSDSHRLLNQISKPSLISSFGLITPMKLTDCATDSPWISGLRQVASRGHLPSGGCLAIEIRLSETAFVFLVGQDADGMQTTLFPSDCPAFSNITAMRQPGDLMRFPPLSGTSQSTLMLDSSPGMERVYAIAITEKELAERFADRTAQYRGLCCRPPIGFASAWPSGPSESPEQRVRQWQNYLKQLSDRFPGMVEWREILFWHDPP